MEVSDTNRSVMKCYVSNIMANELCTSDIVVSEWWVLLRVRRAVARPKDVGPRWLWRVCFLITRTYG